MRIISVCLIALLLAQTVAAKTAAPAGDLDQFIATYRCAVLEILKRIHGQPLDRPDRYLILSVDDKQRYVQCHFEEDDKVMYCEASSGLYAQPRTLLRLSRAQRAAIAALGFARQGDELNFQETRALDGESGLWDIAGLMLEALYRGYGASLKRKLFMTAPYVPGRILPRGDTACLAIS